MDHLLPVYFQVLNSESNLKSRLQNCILILLSINVMDQKVLP